MKKLKKSLFQFHRVRKEGKQGKGYIFFIAVFVGILLGMQINSASSINRELSYPVRKIANQINQEKHQIKHLKREIFREEREMKKLEKSRLGESKSYLELKKHIEYLKIVSGESKVVGEGVVFTIDSGKDENIALKIDYKKVLLLLINELRLNGAEVISVNGQQITNLTGITLAGTHLDVNNTEIGPPYEIKIIGDSDRLYDFLDRESTTVMFMRKVYQFRVNLKKASFMEITETKISKPITEIIGK